MEASWNLCFSTYTWFSYFSFILNYFSLFVHIPNFLNFFSLLFARSGKFFENRTFLYPLKLKNRKIHTNENKLKLVLLSNYLKGLFTNFEYITFFSCPTKRNIFCNRFISIKPLWLEIIEKKGCTKSVRVIYIIYIIVLGWTDFVHPFF